MPVVVEISEIESVIIYKMATLDLQGKPFMWVSAYLVDGLLIDCGFAHAKDDFLKVLDYSKIECCILSHHHEDHYGACHDLVIKRGIQVFSTLETAFLVRQNISIPPERKLVWGIPHPVVIQELPNNLYFNTEKSRFKIIPTPGHCKNLISIYDEKRRILFSTDAFINKKQTVIFNWEDANEMLRTFKKLHALNFRYILMEDGTLATRSDLRNLIEYWIRIKLQCKELHDSGLSSKQIVPEVFGKESSLKKMTGGDMSRENLIRSFLKLPPLDFRKRRKGRKKKKT